MSSFDIFFITIHHLLLIWRRQPPREVTALDQEWQKSISGKYYHCCRHLKWQGLEKLKKKLFSKVLRSAALLAIQVKVPDHFKTFWFDFGLDFQQVGK